jgi:regulator of sirC expression with transglutaminase-like and TPR domain
VKTGPGWLDASFGATLRALRLGEDARRLTALGRRLLRGGRVVVPHGPPGPTPPLLEALLRGDDRRLDIGLGAALLAAEEAEDDGQVERALAQVEELAAALRARLARVPRDDPAARLGALNQLFFEEAGFTPSSTRASRTGDDRLADLLLTSVLHRRRGHCVGLSCAYLAVGLRAGLPLFGVSAPGHFFVRWDGEGLRRNVETTARGLAHDDEHYIEHFRIAPQLVDRGVYLQSLRRREVLAEVLNNRANFYWDRGDAARAARDLDRIVQVSHGFARAFVGRGFVALQQGDLLAADRALARALEIDPADVRALLLRGELELRRGDVEAAERALTRAVEAETSPLALTNLGRVHSRRGDHTAAAAWHRRALAADPACLPAQNNLGVALRALGDVEGARRAFRAAAALDPDLLAARENLVLLGRDDDGRLTLGARLAFGRVCRAYERRLRRAPGDEEQRGAYVRFLLEAGLRGDRALAVAHEGTRTRRSPRSLELLAGVLERRGDRPAARVAIDDALALERDRGGPDVARLERRLQGLAGDPA